MKRLLLLILGIFLVVNLIWLIPVVWLGSVLKGENTELYRVESPDGSRYAVVTVNDQGALGGTTFVDVVEKPTKLLFFPIKGESRRIYTGKWSEHDSIRVSWKDNSTLLINGIAYHI